MNWISVPNSLRVSTVWFCSCFYWRQSIFPTPLEAIWIALASGMWPERATLRGMTSFAQQLCLLPLPWEANALLLHEGREPQGADCTQGSPGYQAEPSPAGSIETLANFPGTGARTNGHYFKPLSSVVACQCSSIPTTDSQYLFSCSIAICMLLSACGPCFAQSCLTLWDPWDWVASQAPLSMGFFRQEYWSGLPFPPPGDLPNPGIKPESSVSPA